MLHPQRQFLLAGRGCQRVQARVGAVPGAGRPLLPVQQPLLPQPHILQPHHILHVHADQAPPDRADLPGEQRRLLTFEIAQWAKSATF